MLTDKLDYSPAGLGFRHRGAPERRNGTKRQGRPYHVCTCVIRVVDAKYSPTLSVRSFTGIDFSLERVSGLLALNSEKPAVDGEYSVQEGCTLVL